jgi:glucose-6-phosphate dehydrogenase assembly protein OpcA
MDSPATGAGTTRRVQTIDEIEPGLSALMRDAAGLPVGAPVVRARMMNLIVFGSIDENDRASRLLRSLSEVHPARAIVITMGDIRRPPALEIQLEARCNKAGSRHLCFEQVSIAVAGPQVEYLPRLVEPILLSHVPCCLWWHGPLTADDTFQGLAALSDRVIVDSAAAADGQPDLVRLAQRVNSAERHIVDMNWARGEVWRELLGGLFNTPDGSSNLACVCSVNIKAALPTSSSSLLMLGWLASRLGWKAGNDGLALQCANGRPASIAVEQVPGSRTVSGLCEVSLRMDGSRVGEFAVRCGPWDMATTIRQMKGIELRRTGWMRGTDEVKILESALKGRADDPIFREALIMAQSVTPLLQTGGGRA